MSASLPTRSSTLWSRATGEARYAADLIPSGAVVAGMARSPHAHARVQRVDTHAALDVPGVLAVLTPADFEGVALGHLRADEPVLTTTARYVGDGVAAVAATDSEALLRGVEALEIERNLEDVGLGRRRSPAARVSTHLPGARCAAGPGVRCSTGFNG